MASLYRPLSTLTNNRLLFMNARVKSLRKLHRDPSTTKTPVVHSTVSDNVCRIVLSNPKQRNVLSSETLLALKDELKRNSENNDVRCIVLSAEGGVFSAGHDLKEFTMDKGAQHHEYVFKLCTEVMETIQSLPIPVVAQVNGFATAGGFQLVASCDIVIATDKSKFSTPGSNVGLFCSTPGVAVARSFPSKVTNYLLYTGLPITATEAAQYGFVSKVVPQDQLDEETNKVVISIVSKSRVVNQLGKECIQKQTEMDTHDAYSLAEKYMVKNLKFVDAQEGIKAFKEKRPPTWTHTDSRAK